MALFAGGKKNISQAGSQIGYDDVRIKLGSGDDVVFTDSFLSKLMPFLPVATGILILLLHKKGKK